jgi:hypothetical protein
MATTAPGLLAVSIAVVEAGGLLTRVFARAAKVPEPALGILFLEPSPPIRLGRRRLVFILTGGARRA